MEFGILNGVIVIITTGVATGSGAYVYTMLKERKDNEKDVVVLREQISNFISRTGNERAKYILENSKRKKLTSAKRLKLEAERLRKEKTRLEEEYLKEEMLLLAQAREKLNELIYIDDSKLVEKELNDSYKTFIKTADRAKKERIRLNKIIGAVEFAIKKNLLDDLQSYRNKLFTLNSELSKEELSKSVNTNFDSVFEIKREITRLKKAYEAIINSEKENLLRQLDKQRNDMFLLIKDWPSAKEELEASYRISMDLNSIINEIDRLTELISTIRKIVRQQEFNTLLDTRSKLESHINEDRMIEMLNKSYNTKLNDVILPKEIERLEESLKTRDMRMNQTSTIYVN